MTRGWIGCWLALVASGCAVEELDDTSVGTQAINGPSSPASQWQRDRTGVPRHPSSTGGFNGNFCTATRIAAHFVLTSAHCQVAVGDRINFYTSGPGFDTTKFAQVVGVVNRPGVNGLACFNSQDGCIDTSGQFSDMTVVQIDRDGPVGEAAVLEWYYAGGLNGAKVGAGNHDNAGTNTDGTLLQVADQTDSSTDSDGSFFSVHDRVDKGDSGGPFYANGHMLGTLWGEVYRAALVKYESRHTSVPKHLDWILSKIGYQWIGMPPQSERAYNGTLMQSLLATERVCQYACENTASCEAYNFITSNGSCGLYTNVTSSFPNTHTHSALHYGQSSAHSGTAAGYVRSDGFNTIVHPGIAGSVRELALTSTGWQFGTISNGLTVNGVPRGPAPALASKLSGYRRADGTNAIVYRSTSNLIIEISLSSAGWDWADLSAWGGATPAGDPIGFVRADGVSAVVYRATNNHLIELRLDPTGWLVTDMTAQSGVPVTASSDPSAYIRSDGYTSVVFRSGTQIFELFKHATQPWDWGQPSAFAAGAPAAATDPRNPLAASATKPYGYTHHDGTNAIIYRNATGGIEELWLDGLGWHAGALGSVTNAVGNPTAYVRTDTLEAVAFRSTDQFIWEIANQAPWTPANISSWGTPWSVASSDPSVFIRTDGFNSMVFAQGTSTGDLTIHVGDTAWGAGSPSASAGEP